MLRLFRQIGAVTGQNLRGLPQRTSISVVVVIGVATTVAVLVSVLAMAAGFSRTVGNTGRPDRIIVLRAGSSAETASALSRANAVTIMDAPGIRKDTEGRPLASAESVAVVSMPLKTTGTKANITLRGVGPKGLELRPEIRLVAGRMFEPGVHELIVGKSAAAQFRGLEPGNRVSFRNVDWLITGAFESGGDSHESELIGSAETVLSALHRNEFQLVLMQLESAAALETPAAALTSDPTLTVDVKRETDYYAAQSRQLSLVLSFVAYVVGSIMAAGAIFGTLNTMYSAVAARTLEIGTLRAIGFGSAPIVISVLIEAMLLALAGSLVGALLAWAFFNGRTVNTLGSGFTQVVFQLTVTPPLVRSAILWACFMGMVGGLLPALRAARMPVVAALRAT